VSFTASGLQSIAATFELLNLQTLSVLSLRSVGGINFVILPLLQSMSLSLTQAGNVRISDTQLSALDSLSLSTVGDFGIGKPVKYVSDRRQRFLSSLVLT